MYKKTNAFEECFNPNALLLSWERVNASVGADAKDYFGITIFKKDLEKQLDNLSSLVLNQEYKPQRPFKYFEPKSSGTQRTKTVLSIQDAIIYQAIANHIAEKLYNELTETNNIVFGSVLNKDVQQGTLLLTKEPDDYYFFEYYVNLYNRFIESIKSTLNEPKVKYIFETDITGFFDTIPHATLIQDLRSKKIEDEILELFAFCLNIWSGTRDRPTIGVGIPQGPAASFLFANITLHSLDKIALNKKYRYFRFMDDIRIYGESKEELNSCLVLIDRELKSKGLCLNTEKTTVDKIKEKDGEKERLLESSGFEIEDTKIKELKELDDDILEQDVTQLKDDQTTEISSFLPSNIISTIYKFQLNAVESKLVAFKSENRKKTSKDFSKTELREFLNLCQKWRTAVKILKENNCWVQNKEMIPIWLFGIEMFFWKANTIVWNLQYYDELKSDYAKTLKTFEKFKDYEWVQYQILRVFNIVLKSNKPAQEYFLHQIPKEESPLVRLGLFLALLDNITEDSGFFEEIAKLIKLEPDEYVKVSLLNTIHHKHLDIPIDILKNWFL